jgi:uncharacterized membrane protein
MTVSFRHISLRVRLRLLALAAILLLFALLAFLPPDGLERAEWALFVGRFHLLVVHFPIALILLVPVLELAGRSRHLPDAGPWVDFILGLATFSAIVASILGWYLARSDGSSGDLVTQHMWGGVALTAACWLCWILHGRFSGERMDLVYALALVVAVGLVSWTGYRGGQLSQGENHLTEYMPAGLGRLLGVSAHDTVEPNSSNGGPATFYGARIQPLFTARCVSCHGRSKRKGKLRLDSFDQLMHGGKHGLVIKAGDAKGSELFHRITLPRTDDDFMPAENKRPLSPDEVKLIELWISAGASGTQAADAIKGLPTELSSAPVAEVTFEEIDPAAVQKQRAALAPTVAQLQKQFPDTLDYESRGSADLVVNMSLRGSKFGDEDLAALRSLASQIVVADFSNTAITNRSAAVIAAMKRLRVLRLAHTKITDATVLALGGLDQLESVSVFGTTVTPAALSILGQIPKLQHIYVGETKITADASIPDTAKSKVVF